MIGILGKKIGMTRVIQDSGRVIPVTVVQCEPNQIAHVKTPDKDGYPALVLGFGVRKHQTKTKKFYHLKEFRIEDVTLYKSGDAITVEVLKDAKTVTITGTSKGKGFQGNVKRHGFAGGPASHGSHQHREPGSVGARAKPGRIVRGKRMAGHMGNETVTVKGVPVMLIDTEKNLVAVKGPVPGARNSLVILKKES